MVFGLLFYLIFDMYYISFLVRLTRWKIKIHSDSTYAMLEWVKCTANFSFRYLSHWMCAITIPLWPQRIHICDYGRTKETSLFEVRLTKWTFFLSMHWLISNKWHKHWTITAQRKTSEWFSYRITQNMSSYFLLTICNLMSMERGARRRTSKHTRNQIFESKNVLNFQ